MYVFQPIRIQNQMWNVGVEHVQHLKNRIQLIGAWKKLQKTYDFWCLYYPINRIQQIIYD